MNGKTIFEIVKKIITQTVANHRFFNFRDITSTTPIVNDISIHLLNEEGELKHNINAHICRIVQLCTSTSCCNERENISDINSYSFIDML